MLYSTTRIQNSLISPARLAGSPNKALAGPVLLLALLMGLLSPHGLAQQDVFSALEQDANKWTTLHLNYAVDERLTAGIGLHNRIGEDLTTFRRMRYRLLVDYQYSPATAVGMGVDRIENRNPTATENRIWQQHMYTLPDIGRLSLSFRTRIEQRMIDGVSGAILRTRHMIAMTYPLGDEGKWYLQGWEELFLNWNTRPEWPQSVFAQNRLFLGLGYHLNPSSRVEVGYQARYMDLNSPRPDELNHILFIQAFYNF